MERRVCAQFVTLLFVIAIWSLWALLETWNHTSGIEWTQARPASSLAAGRAAALNTAHPAAAGSALSRPSAAADTTAAAAAAAAAVLTVSSNAPQLSAYGCPVHPIYNDPWVRNNIALTYALGIRDGLGGQVQRIMGIFAIAKTLGIGYVHSPFECIGHIGPHPHYRRKHCTDLEPQDQLLLQRVIKYLNLPTTSTANVTSWSRTALRHPLSGWNDLAATVESLAQQRQPAVIKLEMMAAFLTRCPDAFHHVPSWRPDWLYGGSIHQVPAVSSPWLLTGIRPVRIAVHMRRGDMVDHSKHKDRYLPVSYYINVVKRVTQILDLLNHDYTVEWFTEPANTAEGNEDMLRIRREVPNLSIFVDTDLLWNWHQMASADIFVMSSSAYSYVPALVNAQGLLITAKPAGPCRNAGGGCHPSNWLEVGDNSGVLSGEIVREMHRRWTCSSGGFDCDSQPIAQEYVQHLQQHQIVQQ